MLAQLFGTHVGIRQQRAAGEPRRLDLPGAGDALLDGRGEFTRPAIRQLLVGNAGDVEMDVDAVQQRSTDPLLIAADRPRSAGAGTSRIAKVAARTTVQKVIKARSLNGPIRWRDIAEGRLGDRAMNAPISSRDLTLRAFIGIAWICASESVRKCSARHSTSWRWIEHVQIVDDAKP